MVKKLTLFTTTYDVTPIEILLYKYSQPSILSFISVLFIVGSSIHIKYNKMFSIILEKS